MKRWQFSLILLPLIFVGFIFGVIKLFQLRFDHGDVYPPSSSLRSDPLGAKVFYESLRELNSIGVQRLYDPLNKIGSGRDKTLFLLGTGASDLSWVPRSEMEEIEQFVRSGGRLVISFEPLNTKGWDARRDEKRADQEQKEREEQSKARKKKKPLEEDDDFPVVSLLNKWNLKLAFKDLETDDDGVAFPVTVMRSATVDSLPEILPWHTALHFEVRTNDWETLYLRDETNAVVIQRNFGKGTIVLSSDSYLFSNEAMRKAREPELLAWLVGSNQNVFFDETHFGIAADPGIAALARKYRLHGLIAGLLLLAALFVWKNSVSFVPPLKDDLSEERDALVAGKESAAGFVNLLRRNISRAEILSACFSEWKKSGAHQRQKAFGKMGEIEALVRVEESRSARERNPVQRYRDIATLLNEKK